MDGLLDLAVDLLRGLPCSVCDSLKNLCHSIIPPIGKIYTTSLLKNESNFAGRGKEKDKTLKRALSL